MGKKKIAISLLMFIGFLSISTSTVEAASTHHALNQMHYHRINNIYKTPQNCSILQNRVLDQYGKQTTAKSVTQKCQNDSKARAAVVQTSENETNESITQENIVQQQVPETTTYVESPQDNTDYQAQQEVQQQANQQQATQQQAPRVHHNDTPQRTNGHHSDRHH
ncbi:hypothetical protein SAMN04487821_107129 [Enterococcus malodoratus]|uniref:hypothetical protein n=1 Tax=Enterococcus malodoratus TaxID=71451 RepID=UPI0008AB3035|nr:hypothetical protein [Enterococcus malodoratus]SET18675.1 hypothetical protein SAMN04487821_107129 [Enterococcus malodoratus]